MLQQDSISTVNHYSDDFSGTIETPLVPELELETPTPAVGQSNPVEELAAIAPEKYNQTLDLELPTQTSQNQTTTAENNNTDLLTGGLTPLNNNISEPWNLDVDGDGTVGALSDGLMIVRYLFGAIFSGDALTDGAISSEATRTTEQIRTYIQQGIDLGALDLDGDGKVEALSDGLMTTRYLLGSIFAEDALTNKAISLGATRTTEQIRSSLANLETLENSSTTPVVSLIATDNSLGEANNPGQFTLNRTGPTDQALTVVYNVSGTATFGQDYQLQTGNSSIFTNSINFGVGESSKVIDIVVTDDSIIEASETVTINLLNNNNNYSLGATSTTTLSIEDDDPNSSNSGGIEGKTVPASGDYQIDALTQGNKWDLSNSDNVLTYSFLSDAAADSYYGTETVAEMNETFKATLRDIIENVIGPWVNIEFQEVSDSATSFGKMRFMLSTGPSYAYAYSPHNSLALGGDVHFNVAYQNNNGNNSFLSGPGSHGYVTLLHETLHALGLKHAGDYDDGDVGPFVPVAEDHSGNTVMSYFLVSSGGRAVTPMPYDLKAINYVYGINTFNSSDTTYVFDKVDRYSVNNQQSHSASLDVKQTLWDTNGVDTLDFSALATNTSGYRFDLNEGNVLTTQSAYNTGTNYSSILSQSNTTTAYGTWIAFDTVIENLINSTSNDEVFANNVANRFSGYQLGNSVGDDVYWYTDSLDILDLQSYSANNISRTRIDDDELITLGIDGSIRIKDYYLESKMQILLG